MTHDPEALFVAHQHRLFKYFLRAVGRIDTARDLTQDVFVRVSRATIPDASADDIRSWLFSIARNLALDHFRQRSRHPEPAAIAPDDGRPPSQDVDLAVNDALRALPDLERDVFLMREVAGLSYDEIGRACDLTHGAVRSRIHRARLLLRERLAAPIATRRMTAMRRSGRDHENRT
jgi:RNA polymerase sigma-70 factor (ECF subfamily)